MSRKSRRNRARQPVRGATPPARSIPTGPSVKSETLMAAAAPAAPAAEATVAETEYGHVVGEIRRIGIMAGAMLIILIVLAIILS